MQKGWKAFVQTGSQERARTLDAHLWTYRDDSFLAHGLAGQAHEEMQPILLSHQPIPSGNSAQVRFFVDGALPDTDLSLLEGIERGILMFDGHNEDALQAARQCWKVLKKKEMPITYWQQTSSGGWEKKA